MSAWPASQREHRYCNFCGRAEHEVVILMAGPNGVFICDECVDRAGEIIAAKRRKLQEANIAARHGGGE